MSFGFGVGDLIAATEAATNTLSSLTALESGSDKDSVIILSFRALQAQIITELQHELHQISLHRVQELHSPETKPALSDVAGESVLSHINSHLDSRLNNYGSYNFSRALHVNPNFKFNFRELNKDIREAKLRKQAFWERIWMGALGGIAVIGPMLLMSLHRTLTTSLVTSSVATVLFTLVLALGARNLNGQEVLGAVAAYAAVLVVFIGTSIPPVS